jgi:DNA-binding CsgD family transcriptional regulator
VIKTNLAADEILRERDGLRVAGGTVVCDNSCENRELQRLVRQALNSPYGSPAAVTEAVAVSRRDGRSRLGVLVRAVPLGALSEGQHRPAVALFIRDSERGSQPSQATLMQLFELTPAEALLALELAGGATLDEAAETLGIRRNTARAHLRSIFAKVGVTRQTMLVRAILNSVASLGEPLAGD